MVGIIMVGSLLSFFSSGIRLVVPVCLFFLSITMKNMEWEHMAPPPHMSLSFFLSSSFSLGSKLLNMSFWVLFFLLPLPHHHQPSSTQCLQKQKFLHTVTSSYNVCFHQIQTELVHLISFCFHCHVCHLFGCCLFENFSSSSSSFFQFKNSSVHTQAVCLPQLPLPGLLVPACSKKVARVEASTTCPLSSFLHSHRPRI